MEDLAYWVLEEQQERAILRPSSFLIKEFSSPESLILPEIGKRFRQGEALFLIEQTKALFEIASPIDGTVKEVRGDSLDSLWIQMERE